MNLNETVGSSVAFGTAYIHSHPKRIFDIAAASTLVVILVPLFVCIALLIKATSPGPILFSQVRNGRGLRPFRILKFRTMSVTESEGEVRQAERNDPRVTLVGRFLRRTSLDELPQLINVIRGEMSLVGPRPHAVAHDRFFAEELPTYTSRFHARPGITGLAQVSGARGETLRTADMQHRVDFDIRYLKEASIPMDLMILARTVREVAVSRTAY